MLVGCGICMQKCSEVYANIYAGLEWRRKNALYTAACDVASR